MIDPTRIGEGELRAAVGPAIGSGWALGLCSGSRGRALGSGARPNMGAGTEEGTPGGPGIDDGNGRDDEGGGDAPRD